ncbi:hypothetical protein NIASO_09765 [Niabella soli DSM 19437]|uniref:Uncharacterized protein n=1 Tax=Niabella soli DSM 19437 TaxID=929713 RepID=W0F856_9BACT|nr:hypothetical protein NIASO_09765 [Niabella soli DSM 19437]
MIILIPVHYYTIYYRAKANEPADLNQRPVFIVKEDIANLA